jgi:kinesin family protein 3/17
VEESISTLKFADRAKQVMVHVRVNESKEIDPAMVERLQREVAHLRALLAKVSAAGGVPRGLGEGADGEGGGEGGALALIELESEVFNLKEENSRLKTDVRQGGAQQQVDGGAMLPHVQGGGGNNGEVLFAHQKQQMMAETDGLRRRNRVLEHAVRGLNEVTDSFFSFEVEEEELKNTLSEIFKKVKADSSLATVPLAGQGFMALPHGLPGGVGAAAAPSLQRPSRPSGAGAGPDLVYRVRGKGVEQNSVRQLQNDEEAEEAAIKRELKEAKKRMKKHLKLQQWLKEKEEREIQMLQMEEEAIGAHHAEQLAKEAARKRHAQKQKKKLQKHNAKIRSDALQSDQEARGYDSGSGG